MKNNPSVPYVAPFLIFLALLAIQKQLAFLGEWEYAVRVAIVAAVIWIFSRKVLDLRVRHFGVSLAIGIGVFLFWIAPDTLFPGWRQHWLFTNSITGEVRVSLGAEQLASPFLLVFRTLSAALLVPVLEELFWRAWMLRWLIKRDFETLPMGSYDSQSFWIVAALFALEHGPYWEVGLLTGIIYNWWFTRTKSLGDIIFVHGVTNLVLSLYVIWSGKWQFWM
ncbi:CAAX prenyl protease-related protein [Bryobacter aggregatus]|uniref:CAAX prenyl protease-related protein n=1 Tax=Bryobacter aggregatus TaxID=360054 RepID=UPI0012BAE0F1|nr:CAAX prenyl protease-related protein [Bryobacter aggregatus]